MESTRGSKNSNHRFRSPHLKENSPEEARNELIVKQRAKAKLKLMYPNEPDTPQMINRYLPHSVVTLTLKYASKTLKVQCYQGTSFTHVPYLLHKQLLYYQMQSNYRNPLQRISRVVGFESLRKNIIFDYRLSVGNGEITGGHELKCFYYSKEKGLQRYKIYRCLAIGGFSKVYLVRCRLDGRFFAMKVMDKQFIFQNQKQAVVTNQRDICTQLDHPFIVKLYHAFETRKFTFFIFQYCPGGQLFYLLKRVKRMTEEQARFYFFQILYGLQYLHQKGIIYRDLKPQNLLITADGHIKIADFGLSKMGVQQGTMTYSYCGSAQYMPPQMILRTGHSFGVDFYTLGALLYELVTGLPPFYSRNQNQIRQLILYEPLQFPPDLYLSDQLKSLLRGLLNKNQRIRLGCLKGIREILFHPWLGKVDSKTILNKTRIPPFKADLSVLNFDDNELGDDQKQFTSKLTHQAKLKHTEPNQLCFEGLFYQSPDRGLTPQHHKLIQQYQQIQYSQTDNSIFKKMKQSPYLSKLVHRKQFIDMCQNRQTNSTSCDRQLNNSNSIYNIRKIYGGGQHSHSRRNRDRLVPLRQLSNTKLVTLQKHNDSQSKLKFTIKANNIYD